MNKQEKGPSGSNAIYRLAHKYSQITTTVFIVCTGLLLCSPAYAFPTPEVVWVVGGALLTPALILFPIFLFLWRHFEWTFKWLHLRAYANRRYAVALLVLGLMGLGELSDRIEEGGVPEPTTETAPLESQEFKQLLETISNELQVIDVRSKHDFNLWHIENSVNLPGAHRRDLQSYFDKNSKKYNVILCYGGDRSNRAAHYLRQVYGTTVIRSVKKGVFALRLQETGHEPYYVRRVTPSFANSWVSYGLAQPHKQSSIQVDMGHGLVAVEVVRGDSLPAFVVNTSSALRSLFSTSTQAFAFLLLVTGALFFTIIYRRKKSQALYLPHLPYAFEMLIVSVFTFCVGALGSCFPDFYGRTAQQVTVWGENSFSTLMVFYLGLIGLPLTWHLHHTWECKLREVRDRVEWVREGISKPWRFHPYLNIGPVLAFFVVVYFSVEVNCAGLWALAFSLWCTMFCEWASTKLVIKSQSLAPVATQVEGPAHITTSFGFLRAQKQWHESNLDEVALDATNLSETCSEVNGVTYSLFLERLYPSGSQQQGLRALGVRTRVVGVPMSRLLLIGDQLYRATHPLLEGFRAGRLEIRMQQSWANKLEVLWLRRAEYWLNQHLLPLCQKHVSRSYEATTSKHQQRCLKAILKDLEQHFAPFQETAVRLHGLLGPDNESKLYRLGKTWSEVLVRGDYTLHPQMREDWPSLPWSELTITKEAGTNTDQAMAAGLHTRASLLVLCLHDLAGTLLAQLGTHWAYGDSVFEMRRDEVLLHGRRPWQGMKAALQARSVREKPWRGMEPGRIIWRGSGELESLSEVESKSPAVVLSRALVGDAGRVMEAGEAELVPGAVVVLDRLGPSDLAIVREAKAIYCTRGSPLSHFVLVAREWGLPVFKITRSEKEELLAEEMVRFEPDGSWRAASF
ncbi:MAG: hypothetical protein HOI23_00515 [Deltaproteobacteria bacterium]|nr:hypothetical protein [Deltaproteobacteria bacterium]MBT6432211.1 hypothetical protein [Deltaproteobacteria bacterium]MBT6490623.1 hypothetical protein [Deltaproteobacteria bacterium]